MSTPSLPSGNSVHAGTDVLPRLNWSGRLVSLLAEELAPNPRRLKTTLRMAVIGTAGAALMASCHVQNQLGTYLVWLLIGPVAMMSPRNAVAALLTLAPMLAASVQIAGMLADAPWLMLAFLFLFTAISTYLNIALELGGFGLIIQVVVLNTFYGVTFNPADFGWQTSALFGGSVIAFALIALFDNWIWPDPAAVILPESISASVARNRSRFVDAADFYLSERAGRRPPEPPFTSGMPDQLALLDRARVEGLPAHRRAILLAAISREERLHIQIDRLTVAARSELPREARMMFRPEAEAAVRAIASALSELESEILTGVRTGPDNPPSPAANRARAALDTLDARIIELRPTYINRISPAEAANFGEFTEVLHAMVRLIERPLDEPPAAPPASAVPAAPRLLWPPDPAVARYCAKGGLCVVIGYIIGLTSHRPELATVLTTIIITALPTYGASMRKMILRIIGAILGGVIAILAIMIVSPNFSTLPSYMLAIFIVLYASGYASLASGRTAYAGKQIATTFLLVFADLSPSLDVYGPLWRMWGIFIGTFVVTIIFFFLWPVYAGDSLLPRLRKVLRGSLALAPGGAAFTSIATVNALNTESMHVLGEILEVANDARLEGRASLIDHEALVQGSGTLRRIANRFAAMDQDFITAPLPPLDDATKASRDAVFKALRARLESWLAFYESKQCLNRAAAIAFAARHSRSEISQPLEAFTAQLGADGFARISSWSLAQRRRILAELESLRRLEFLMFELSDYLSRVPGSKSAPSPALLLRES
jgi:hypothetical protein